MIALNKQALIAKIKKQTESFDTVVLKEDEANALLDELKSAENNLLDSECHVAELEESLRDKQALLEALDNAICELLPGTKYMDHPDGGSVTQLEQVRRMVADYRGRIEELESRTVRISRPKIGRLHGALLHLWPEYDVQAAVEHAGIKFKVED